MGYELLNRGRVDDAIAVFMINTRLFPESANVFDSLGEGYLRAGEFKKAEECYLTALALEPDLESALQALRAMSHR